MSPVRLSRLRLKNFRGFEALALAFETDLTVLVGANGAGKTTVVDALIRSDWPTSGKTRKPEFSGREFRLGADHCALTFEFSENGKPVGETNTSYRLTHNGGWTGSEPSLAAGQPALFVYGVNRSSHDQTPGTTASSPWGANEALHSWHNAAASYDEFFRWFKEKEDLENEQIRYEGGEPNPQLDAVRRAIMALLPEVAEIRVRRHMQPIVHKPVLAFRKGDVLLPFDALSEGERTTIAMVGDLARRLVLLDQHEDALQTAAIVAIDEIEQHAHPGWQRHMLKRLRHTFPNVQFIVTTHSPIIVSEVEPRQLRVLKDFQLVPTLHGTGRDANVVLEDVFGVPPRNEEVQQALDALGDALDADQFEVADQLLRQLDELVPGRDEPEVVYYRNLLARLRAQ